MSNVSTFYELQCEVAALGDKINPASTQASIISHLRDEVNKELHPDCSADELADVAIFAMLLAHRRGLNLEELIRQKHAVNLQRKWGEPDERGVVKHVEEQP